MSALALALGLGLVAAATTSPTSVQAASGALVTTVAGNDSYAAQGLTGTNFGGDGGPALDASMTDPYGVAVNSAGDLFIADTNDNRVREVNSSGIISTIAGNGTAANTGDGGPAIDAELAYPSLLATDSSGDLFVGVGNQPSSLGDNGPTAIREIASNGDITTVYTAPTASNGATEDINGIAVSSSGDLYVALAFGGVVEVSPTGVVTTIAEGSTATGSESLNSGCATTADGGPALDTAVCANGIGVDAAGDVFVLQQGQALWEIAPNGTISTFYSGFTLGAAGLAVDAAGNLFVQAEASPYVGSPNLYDVIDEVNTEGVVSVVAGSDANGAGTSGPALDTGIAASSLGAGPSGSLYVGQLGGYVSEITGISVGPPVSESSCSCATTGEFTDPATENPANNTTSPHGSYNLAATYADGASGGAVTLTITDASSGTAVATISPPASATFTGNPSWGFSPNDTSFALEYNYSGLDVVQLYDLQSSDPSTPVWTSSQESAQSSISFSPSGKYFLATVLDPVAEQASLAIVPTAVPASGLAQPVYSTTFMMAVGQDAGQTDSSAHWGFSPTDSAFTFMAVDSNGDPVMTLVSLPSGTQSSVPLTDTAAGFVRFSPCGDLLAVISQTGPEPGYLEAALYSTSTLQSVASQQISFGNVTVQATPTQIEAIVLTASGATVSTDLTANAAAAGCAAPSTSATAGGSPAVTPQSATGAISLAADITTGSVTMTLPNDRGQIEFPGDVAPTATTFTYTETDDVTSYPLQGEAFAGLAFTLTAADQDGNPVTTLTDSYDDTIDYNPSDLAAAGITDATTLGLYWWNGAAWTSLSTCSGCSVDTSDDTVTVATEQLGEFALLAPAPAETTPAVTGTTLQGSAGTSLSGTIATLTGSGNADAYLAFINWGDGSQSQGIVTPSGTTLDINGAHTYVTAGLYDATVTVTASGSPFLPGTATTSITIAAVQPGAPTGVSAAAGNGQAAVSFTAPADDGGSPVTGYTVTATDTTTAGNGGQTATGSSSPLVVTGLTNGDSYTFTVQAVNAAGPGPASAPSAAVTPIGPPGAPTGVSAAAGNGQAAVSFTAPADDGGSPVTGYTVTATDTTTAGNGGQTATGSSSPLTVTGLTNGDSYTFTVQAVNAAGPGPASAPSAAVTPTAPSQAATVRFAGALTYVDSGDITSGAIDVKTFNSVTTVTGSVTIPGIDGGTATISLNASEILGLGIGAITVRDPGAHLDVSALVVMLEVTASGEVTGTAIGLVGRGSYTLSFSLGSSAVVVSGSAGQVSPR